VKLLYFTDSHIKGKNPISRTGDFVEDMSIKLAEIGGMVKAEGIDKVLFGGDLFDSPSVALNVVDMVVDQIESWGVDFWTIRGNHDEIGHNPGASGQSVLDHIFRRSKIIKHLGGMACEEAYIEGVDYYHSIEEDIKAKGLMSAMPHLEGRKIAVVHAFILDKPFLAGIAHVCIKDIKSDFDLVLIGHTHPDIGIHKKDKTTYVGIGALARISIVDADRKPQVLIIDTATPTMKVVQLQNVRARDVAFDMEKAKEVLALQGRLDEFISSLEGVKFQGLNLKNIIESIAEKENIDKEVVRIVLERIEKYDTA
jgi:DNA repair exonuclease SbcCD nuclease subunit